MTTTAPTAAGLRGSPPRDSDAPRRRHRVRGPRVEPAARSVQQRRVSSLPFLGLIAGLLASGLLGLLMINNSLAAGSFEQARLRSDRILLGEQEQALRQEVERLSSPTRVREAARQAGLVPAATTAYFDVVTGEILGVPIPAGQTVGVDPMTGAVAPVDPVTGQPIDPGAAAPVDPVPGQPIDPGAAAPVDPSTGTTVPGAPSTTAPDAAQPQPPAATDAGTTDSGTPESGRPGAGASDDADGAVVGGEPGGITAYDRAVVSGGGR